MSNSSENDKIENKDVFKHELEIIQFSGPLPHPQVLKEYENIIPGSAEKIFALAEEEIRMLMTNEKKTVDVENIKSILGLIFAFIIAVLGLCGGMFLVYKGHSFYGGSVSVLVLVALTSTFIYGSKKNETQEK